MRIVKNDKTKKTFCAVLTACALWASALASAASTIDAHITVAADKPGPKIDPNIYGHFVEHLGRGAYEGIRVGEGSPMPNVRAIRSDVVSALRKIPVPLVRWPGG